MLSVHRLPRALSFQGVGFRISRLPLAVARAKTSKLNVATNGQAEQQLIGLDEGICYLTKVSGEFDGGGEKASVYAGPYFWHLEVSAVCGTKTARFFNKSDCDRKEITAQARCYKYEH